MQVIPPVAPIRRPPAQTVELDDSGPGEGGSIWNDVLDYVFRIRKHPILFLSVFVIVTAVTVFLGMRQQKVYRAHSTVLVDYNPPKVLKEGDDIYKMSHRFWEYQRYFETQPAVIESREVLQEVVSEVGLAEDEEFLGVAGMEEGPDKLAAMSAVDPVGRLRAHIEVEPQLEGLTLAIMVRDTDAHRASEIANSVANAYIEYQKNQRKRTMSEANEWLRERVTQLGTQVGDAEEALVGFQRDADFIGGSIEDSASLTHDRTMMINMAGTQAELDYLDLKARWAQAQEMVEQGNTGSIPQVLANPSIQTLKDEAYRLAAERSELRVRYGERMPAVKQLDSRLEELERNIALETDRVLMSMKVELAALEEIQGRAEGQLEEQRQLAIDLKEREMQFHGLERDLFQTEDLYKQVRERSLEAELASLLEQSNISVLDRATVPKRPFQPRVRSVLLLGLVLGLGAALLLVFVTDRLDVAVRSPEQLEAEFHLPAVGIQPRYEGREREGDRTGLVVAEEPRGTVAESCRTIRTNLMFMAPGHELQTLLVTSAGPSEGKTTLAANLAYTMAATGARVLLVDTDMRRPKIHRVFGIKPRIGLASVLIGEVGIDEVVTPSGYPNLDLLPLGKIPPNPAELLESAPFRQLVESLRSRYDRVIFDSPPVMAVSDTSILAQHADGTVFVVREDKTNRHVLRQALRTLRTVNAQVLGFVINDVDLDTMRKGYYSYRYRYPYYYYTYRYLSHYKEDGEEAEAEAKPS